MINFDGQSDYIEFKEEDFMFDGTFSFTIDFKFNTLEEFNKTMKKIRKLGDK